MLFENYPDLGGLMPSFTPNVARPFAVSDSVILSV